MAVPGHPPWRGPGARSPWRGSGASAPGRVSILSGAFLSRIASPYPRYPASPVTPVTRFPAHRLPKANGHSRGSQNRICPSDEPMGGTNFGRSHEAAAMWRSPPQYAEPPMPPHMAALGDRQNPTIPDDPHPKISAPTTTLPASRIAAPTPRQNTNSPNARVRVPGQGPQAPGRAAAKGGGPAAKTPEQRANAG